MAEIISYTSDGFHTWSVTGAIAASVTYNLLSKYDNRFSYTSGNNYIDVDNKFTLVFSVSSSSYVNTCTIGLRTPDSPSTDIIQWTFRCTGWNMLASTWYARLIKTEHLYYLEFLPQTVSGDYSYMGGVVYWGILDGKNYFGILGSSAGTSIAYTSRNIESIPIACIENGIATYQIQKIANYRLNALDIFFTPISVISDNSSGEFSVPDDFCSCSNITYRNTISTNNKNYYAVGTNTLVEITDSNS